MVRGVGEWPSWLRIEIETRSLRPDGAGCGTTAWDHGQRGVLLVDLPVFGCPARLAWRKRRWRCPNMSCVVVTWSEHDPTIASERSALTTRAARCATRQVGKHGRAVSEVADDLACDWHTVNDAVVLSVLIDDPARYGAAVAVGLDETLYKREGRYRKQCWSTQIVDVEHGHLLDVVAGREVNPVCAWFAARPQGGVTGCVGRRWISRPRIGWCSTRCSPTQCRSLTRITSCTWRTSRWTSAGGGCRTRPSATAATETIRSTAAGGGW